MDDDMLNEWADRPIRHCSRCGSQMDYVVVRDLGYDEQTGHRLEHLHPRCPQQPRNGWQAMWRGSHDEFCGPGKVAWG